MYCINDKAMKMLSHIFMFVKSNCEVNHTLVKMSKQCFVSHAASFNVAIS